jgi:predicted permease
MDSMSTAQVLLHAILKLFLVGFTGYGIVRFRILDAKATQALSRFVIYVALPCLIIKTLAENLEPSLLPAMGLCALAALGLNLGSLGLSYLFSRFLPARKLSGRRGLLVSLSSIQNSGYLPIPLVMAILPGAHDQAEALLFIFPYILVMGIIFWTVGVWLIPEQPLRDKKEALRRIVNPPVLALALSFLFLNPGIRAGYKFFSVFSEAVSLLGETTIPLVLIVLGASFGLTPKTKTELGLFMSFTCLMKLLLIPGLVLMGLKAAGINGTFGMVLLLQAVMPAAMNHIVAAQEYGGDVPLTARVLFYQYMFSMAAIPLFLYLYWLSP